MIKATVGDAVQPGDAIVELRYREPARLDAALPLVTSAIRVDAERLPRTPLIIEEVL
jgi:hypothetical protein